jgi:hypothetical protein
MMLAVMYGCTPSMTIDKVDNPPPAKILSKDRPALPFTNSAIFSPDIDGIGMTESILVNVNIAMTKKILFLIVFSEKTAFKYLNIYIFYLYFLTNIYYITKLK